MPRAARPVARMAALQLVALAKLVPPHRALPCTPRNTLHVPFN